LEKSEKIFRNDHGLRGFRGCAKFFSRSHDAVVHVYDESGNVIQTHEHKGDFKEWWTESRHALKRDG
jgi:hypothetical protein